MAGSKGGRGGQGAARNSGSGGATPGIQTDDQIIASALGTQGSAASIKDAVKNVNPNYSQGREWQTNCQRCVWATEMQRRGYDVEALPRTSDDSYARVDTKYANSFLNVAQGGLNLEQVVSPYWKSSAAEFKEHFTNKYDVGARGMIVGQGRKSGHVFNWEITQGKNGKQVKFYDGQPGNDSVSVSSIQSKWFYFREARMDNVSVTPLIKDFVKPRGGK